MATDITPENGNESLNFSQSGTASLQRDVYQREEELDVFQVKRLAVRIYFIAQGGHDLDEQEGDANAPREIVTQAHDFPGSTLNRKLSICGVIPGIGGGWGLGGEDVGGSTERSLGQVSQHRFRFRFQEFGSPRDKEEVG
jgi:hypothetical protein